MSTELKHNNGKRKRRKTATTKKLTQPEISIEEQIDMLIEWIAKYPNAKFKKNISEDILKQYTSSEEEYLSLTAQYEQMKKYYTYIKNKKYQGTLTEEQLSKCKEGNIQGVFGYPTSIEQLSKKTGKNKKYIDYIINCYGSMENFINLYRNNELNEKDLEAARSMTRDTIDIDLNPNNNNYDKLYNNIFGSPKHYTLRLYSSEKLQTQLNHLTDKEKLVIEKRFGLLPNSSTKTFKSIGIEMGLTGETIRNIGLKAISKLRYFNFHKDSCTYDLKNAYILTDKERNIIANLEDMLYASNLIFINNTSISDDNIKAKDILKAFELIKNIDEITEERRKQKEIRIQEKINTPLEDVNIPAKAYMYLQKRGITLVGDLRGLSSQNYSELLKKLGKQKYINFLREVAIYDEDYSDIELMEDMTEEQIEEMIKKKKSIILDTHIDDLEFSGRTYNALKRAGKCTLGDISNLTEQELLKIRNFGTKCYEEVIAKLKEYGIRLKESEQIESSEETDTFTIQNVLKKINKQEVKEPDTIPLDSDIEDLGLSVRTYNMLKRSGIYTLGDISNLTKKQLLKITNIGKKSYEEITQKLEKYGLTLKENEQLGNKESNTFIKEVLAHATELAEIRKQDEQAEKLAKDYQNIIDSRISKNGHFSEDDGNK